MKRILLVISLIALGASSKASSDELPFRSDRAASIVSGCRNFTDPNSPGDAFEQGQCVGLLKGLYYLSSGACIPPGGDRGRHGTHISAVH
jgi:hypothetical protein